MVVGRQNRWGWGFYTLCVAVILSIGWMSRSAAGAVGGCATCHQTEDGFSHPIGVAPTMAVSAALPMENGVMTCTTCHDDGETAHARATVDHRPMLRGGLSKRALCMQCHEASSRSAAAMHAVGGPAHVAWQGKRTRTTARAGRTFMTQPESCMGCHDGLISADATPGAVFVSTMNQLSHPIGVDYSRSARARITQRGVAALLPGDSLDERIHLNNGQVTCTSCHSIYSSEKKLLVMSNDHSRLCLSCHQD